MKSIRSAISRILEVDEATDMEAVLFLLRQMEPGASSSRDDSRPLEMPIVTIARDLMEDLSNPYARQLLADRLQHFEAPSGRPRVHGTPFSKERSR